MLFNNNLATLSVNTRVFPEPAFAETHVFFSGFAAYICANEASLKFVIRPLLDLVYRYLAIHLFEIVDHNLTYVLKTESYL